MFPWLTRSYRTFQIDSVIAPGPDGVVVSAECVELLLKLGQAVRFWLAFEEGFESVPDAFGFALGCWPIGFPVSLNDAFDGEEGFEGVGVSLSSGPSGVTGGVDHAVIGEGGERMTVVVDGLGECVRHHCSRHSALRGEIEEESGVAVHPSGDFR